LPLITSDRLPHQVREELREQTAAHQATAQRLKAEKRQATQIRQEKEGAGQALAQAKEAADEAKRREEAAKAALVAAKRDLAEIRRAYAVLKEERDHAEMQRSSQQLAAERVTSQREVALHEVGQLAQELESLQVGRSDGL